MKKNILLLFVFIHLIMNAQTKELWGVTAAGGTTVNSKGVVFKTDISGSNPQVVKNFITDFPGANPSYTHLTETSDGKLYGTTYMGGNYGDGVLFQYDPITNVYSKKKDFLYSSAIPVSSLLLANNGKLYGTTTSNEFYSDYSGLYEYDPVTEVYTKRVKVSTTSAFKGDLTLGSNGKIYGICYDGKYFIYEYDPLTNVFSKKFIFQDSNISGNPQYGLVEGSNGKLYGTTVDHGANNVGTLYEYDLINNIYTKKIDFNSTITGSKPRGSLYLATNNKIYGVTKEGGVNNLGVIFEYDIISNSIIKKYEFNGTEGGKWPVGSLVSSNSKLYGVTEKGGSNDLGVLFEYDLTSNVFTKRVNFDGLEKGSLPYASLSLSSDGNLYGMTNAGGSGGVGVLFKYDPLNNIYTKKFNFNESLDGKLPYGSLLQASNSKIYGLTNAGGLNSGGVLFEYDLVSKSYTVKHDFDVINGNGPLGSLIQTTDGKLYGMTKTGGTTNNGVIFEYDINSNTYLKKIDFDGTNGRYPYGDLLQSSNGLLYGMTYSGGANDFGVLFEYNPQTNVITKKLDFDGTNMGKNPEGSLMQATDGKIYGMTAFGGASDRGIIFQFDPANNNYSKKYNFLGTENDGYRPKGNLLQANNGKFYGMSTTSFGGILFEFDTNTNSLIKKFGLGQNPYGSLMQASNGNVYGMTSYLYQFSGVGYGSLFEYNISANQLTTKTYFDSSSVIRFPYYTKLIEVSYANLATSEAEQQDILIFPNPVKDFLHIKSLKGIIGYKIYSLDGRKLLSKEQNTGLDNIDVSTLSLGNYILKLKMQKGEKTFKFIKN